MQTPTPFPGPLRPGPRHLAGSFNPTHSEQNPTLPVRPTLHTTPQRGSLTHITFPWVLLCHQGVAILAAPVLSLCSANLTPGEPRLFHPRGSLLPSGLHITGSPPAFPTEHWSPSCPSLHSDGTFCLADLPLGPPCYWFPNSVAPNSPLRGGVGLSPLCPFLQPQVHRR